jgi:hypothetical protein
VKLEVLLTVLLSSRTEEEVGQLLFDRSQHQSKFKLWEKLICRLFVTVGQKSFSDAADTLASLSGDNDLGSLSGAHLRRQLCLEKMARLAAPRQESTGREVEAVDRRIALLDLQVR